MVADARPRVALTASGDGGAFDRALDPLEATAGAADFAGAFALAESLETTGDSIAFVFLSDGGLTDAEQALLPPGTTYRAIGDQSTNRAISRLIGRAGDGWPAGLRHRRQHRRARGDADAAARRRRRHGGRPAR